MPTPPTGPSGRPARERLLVYGDTSSGKTSCALSLASFAQRRGSEARFYALSSGDLAYEQMLDAARYADLTNVEYADCFDYGEWMDAAKGFLAAARKRAKAGEGSEDWLVVDLYSSLWTMVQDFYIANVRGEDGDDFWTAAAKRAEGSGSGWALYEDINWQVANKLYREFSQKIMQRWPGHVLAVASAKPVDKDKGGKVTEADGNIGDWFGRLGSKPAGQKEMAYEFRDVLFCRKLGSGKHTITTAKAREREEVLKGAEWSLDGMGFFGAFLRPVCGWKP